MSETNTQNAITIASDTNKDDLFDLLERDAAGESFDGLTVLETEGIPAVLLPDDVALNRPLILGDHLLFVQQDEKVFVLRGGAVEDYVLLLGDASLVPASLRDVALAETDWTALGDAPVVDLAALTGGVDRTEGSGEQARVSVNDPLDGLAISPLLRYTEYDFPVFEEEDAGLGGALPDIEITFPGGPANILLAETDADLDLRFSDYFDLAAAGQGEELLAVGIVLPGLPAGTTANGGRFESQPDGTVTFIFEGSPEDFADLTVTLPPDASTDSRADIAPGDLTGTVYGVSNFGRGPDQDFSVRVTPEADLEMEGSGQVSLTETNDVVEFRPADAVLPAVTDRDGSEEIETVTLRLTGLPDGTTVSGGTLVTEADGSLTLEFEGTLEEYEALTVTLPADFSTTNPGPLFPGSGTISGTVTATTNEGGLDSRDFGVEVAETVDAAITAPDVVRSEDSGTDEGDPIVDGSGVVADLGIEIDITDVDGSENDTNSTVTITFTDLPAGSGASEGTLNGAIWTGTVAEAEALNLILPGDYSGVIGAEITVETPEGIVSATQTITIEPTSDVGFIAPELVTAETDAQVTVRPSDSWEIVINDTDPTSPPEVIEEVMLTLEDLPPGVIIGGVPAGTVSYDPTGGGTFVFTGTEAEYLALTLTFPADYSTTSRTGFDPATEPALTGTLAARSNESAPGDFDETPVSLRIESEQDVEFITNDLTIAETDAALEIVPLDVVRPQAADADGSESVETVTLTATGLPSGTEISLDGGTSFTVIPDADLGQPFSGTADQYVDVVLRLPADFATDPGAPITLTVEAVTDEGTATPATASATVTVPVEGDIEVTGDGAAFALDENDSTATADDGDASPTAPVSFRPGDQLTAAGADADDSDTVARVDLRLTGLPDGTTFSDGAVVFDSTTGVATFTGTYADYLALEITLPDDFSTSSRGAGQGTPGDIAGEAIFTTNEAIAAGEAGASADFTDPAPDPDASASDGVASGSFTVTVAPEADIRLTAGPGTGVEDTVSATNTIPLNLDVAITDPDGSETLIDSLSVTFADLPPDGITLSDGTVITAASPTWTGTAAEMRLLEVTAVGTEHFSGTITATVAATSNESSGPTELAFEIDITPVAEPTIVLSVDDSEAGVVATDPDADPATDNFSVKEDNSFLLTIAADTPDKDGSENLTLIEIENIPTGWLPSGDVLALFESGAGIDSATMSGNTLTIELAPGLDSFTDAIRLTPLADDDRDVATLMAGEDLVATVTAEDAGAGVTNTATAQDGVDVDVDAVVDPIELATRDQATDESADGPTGTRLRIRELDILDDDGSEQFDRVEVTLSVASTESDVFNPSNPADLNMFVRAGGFSSFAQVTQIGSTGDTVTFEVVPAGGATPDQFASAVERLAISVPERFSGVIEVDGTVFWSETQTPITSPGDVENDTSDNTASAPFSSTITIRPVAEAQLDASVFVRNPDFVETGGVMSLSETLTDGSVTNDGVLRLLESTADGTGPDGQVSVFVGIGASTPDTDGSEQLETVVISNIPTSWIDFVGDPIDALRTADGAAPLGADELAKIDLAQTRYDPVEGTLTIAFNDNVTSFNASLELQPSLYEDYDVDGQDLVDPFTADGRFFGDLNVALTVSDSNGAQNASETVDATFDVDVEAVNNLPILDLPTGAEDVIDAAGGTFQIPIGVTLPDTDGTETITSVILRDLPPGLTVWVPDPTNSGGPKVPALFTEVNGAGETTWSLENEQWLGAEIRGLDRHFAGDILIGVDVVTTEANGAIQTFALGDQAFTVYAVADGGTPGGSAGTLEDTAVQVNLSANLIDGADASPETVVDDSLILSGVTADSEGRFPEFYLGDPGAGGTPLQIVGGEILIDDGGTLRQLTWTEAQDLWVLPATDSNETISFDIQLTYQENTPVDPASPGDATATGTGTVTIAVTGVADAPSVAAQDPDPGTFAGTIDPVFAGNEDKLYAYAGLDNAPFTLDKRLTDAALGGDTFDASSFTTGTGDVTLLGGAGQESNAPDGAQDGSETIYYLITGFPAVDPLGSTLPELALLGVQPSVPDGSAYLVTAEQLANLQIISSNVDAPTFYDLTLNVIAVEDDQSLSSLVGQDLASIDALDGVAVSSQDFSVVVLPDDDPNTGGGGPGGGPDCPLEMPSLSLVPALPGAPVLEDVETAFKISLTPNGDFSDLGDLVTLPDNRTGDFTLALDLPAGSQLRSDVPGAVLFDPVSGRYVIDFAKLGSDPTNPLQSDGTLFFTPPPHQSSPNGPFDELTGIETTAILNDFSCGSRQVANPTLTLNIEPVADGPQVVIANPGATLEDTPFDLDVTLGLIDPGEEIVGDVRITLDNGGILLDAAGDPLTAEPDGSYVVAQGDLAGLQVRAVEHYSGPLTVSVTATTEDLNGDTADSTASRTFQIEAVADVPFFLDQSGNPFTGGTLTAQEDVPFTLHDVIDAGSPDMDGSEVVSYVIEHRDGIDLRDIFVLEGPANGIIDNGDGTFTVSADAYNTLRIRLIDQYANTGDPGLEDPIPLRLTVNTFELSNNDENSGSVDFDLVIEPVADTPTLNASIDRTAGVEDDGQPFTLTLSATSPDPSETIDFVIDNIPDGATVLVGGVAQTVTGGSVTISGVADAGGTFAPDGAVTIGMGPDFSGDFDLSVTAVSSDTGGGITDTASSAAEVFPVSIAPAPDITLTADPADVAHTGAPVVFDLGLSSAITDPDEVLEEVIVTFGAALPDGATASAGTLSADRTTITLNAANTAGAGGIAIALAALALTLPADFAGAIAGEVTATTNEGAATPVTFSASVTNDPPDVSGPVDVAQDGQASFTIPFADLLANASDDGPLTVENPGSADTDVTVTVVAGGIEVTVPPGYQGMPVLSYDIVDAAGAATPATANLDIDTLQMVATGTTVTAPDGSGSYALLGDVTGSGADTATGTGQGDAVVFDATDRPYDGITGFEMMGGDDLVDLSAATRGFTVHMGAGSDIVIGGSGNDRLDGGLGADTLTGGAGDDIFVLSEGIDVTDVITDYGDGNDQIDLSSVIQLAVGETIGDRVSFDDITGDLVVDGNTAASVGASGGGVPASVQVIFEDAAGAAQVATI